MSKFGGCQGLGFRSEDFGRLGLQGLGVYIGLACRLYGVWNVEFTGFGVMN